MAVPAFLSAVNEIQPHCAFKPAEGANGDNLAALVEQVCFRDVRARVQWCVALLGSERHHRIDL